MRRFMTSHRFRCTLLAGVLSLGGPACFFDADLPLENDPPACNRSEILTSLIYPDSSVCTLSITDRNDTVLSLSILPCDSPDIDSMQCDSPGAQPWPGTFEFLSTGYGEKQLRLSLDTNRMGHYSGILLLQDADDEAVRIPYSIEKQFFDPFNTYPLSEEIWQPYVTNDSLHIGFDYIDGKIVFSFDSIGNSPAIPLFTGIRSRFSLPSGFRATIDFKLRDEMDEGFEVAFFISSSPDTGRWSGEKAGIVISGVNGRLRFECRSINLQSYSYESNTASGEIGIYRADSTIRYYLHDGNPAVIPKPLTVQFYSPDTPVYVHLKMTVRDLYKKRNCYWNDFSIPEGIINFPPN
ncbi:MAG: hypothetical protein JW913_07370 [Chitinispirillaceae bacterium]|nr:hypothetical protein [Chitinispirillaceae bacterium]